MNLVIVDAGTEAWPAIRRNVRPSVRMAARRLSLTTFRVMLAFLLSRVARCHPGNAETIRHLSIVE